MAPLSTHPVHMELEDVMNKVAAAAWDLNYVASRTDEATQWRSQVRKLADDQLDIQRQLDGIEDAFTTSMKKRR